MTSRILNHPTDPRMVDFLKACKPWQTCNFLLWGFVRLSRSWVLSRPFPHVGSDVRDRTSTCGIGRQFRTFWHQDPNQIYFLESWMRVFLCNYFLLSGVWSILQHLPFLPFSTSPTKLTRFERLFPLFERLKHESEFRTFRHSFLSYENFRRPLPHHALNYVQKLNVHAQNLQSRK